MIQPNIKIRNLGIVTSELWKVFQMQRDETGMMNRVAIRETFNLLGLFPTTSQVLDMVHCAGSCQGKVVADYLQFGEFVMLVTELRELYRQNPGQVIPRSKIPQREKAWKQKANCVVFLGGSCNPTTWRKDRAIPFLKEQSIAIYNPQVNEWKPELLEIEEQEKQKAEILFFVIDNQTRSTSSMVEAAYLAGRGRQLILVIKNFNGPGDVVCGEKISEVEFHDLQRSHDYLVDLVERQRIPVFKDLDVALACTAKAITQGIRVTDFQLADKISPVKHPTIHITSELWRIRETFHSYDSKNTGTLTFQDVCQAYKTLTSETLPTTSLMDLEKNNFSFDEFCCVVAEFKYKRKNLIGRAWDGINRCLSWLRGEPLPHAPNLTLKGRDVFLGGTCGDSKWRDEVARPIFMEEGITFFNPIRPEWKTRHIAFEAGMRDACKVLLYIITKETRGITSMLEAAHFIGHHCEVVLCVIPLPENECKIDGELLTSRALKDYNRARSYLEDLANRSNIPIFKNIDLAVRACCKKVKKE